MMNEAATRRHRWVTLGLVVVLLIFIGNWAWLKRNEHLREEQRRLDFIKRHQTEHYQIVEPPKPSPFKLLAVERSGPENLR